MPNFELIKGEDKNSKDKEWVHVNLLLEEYKCEMKDEPRWCICGRGPGWQIDGIVALIRPCAEEEVVSRQIANSLNQLGGDVTVEMTEFNPELRTEPFYTKYRKRLDIFLDRIASMPVENDPSLIREEPQKKPRNLRIISSDENEKE